ncbi:hypothetical protein D3Y55_15210 [Mesorhizobium sp. DCY119]|nr:hypothetical protein D3Y55_15210 [Mesorhizobium sp. DCY119]
MTVEAGTNPAEERFLNGKQVRARYAGISKMTLHRWVNGYTDQSGKHHPPHFPEAIRIGHMPLWRLSDLETWERSRAATRH